MTRTEYAAYEAAVAAFYDRTGVENLSTDHEDESSRDEFSWRRCECCGTHLGGARSRCTGYNRQLDRVLEFTHICDDCVYYAAYGQLDDMTMMDLTDDDNP